MGGGMIRPPGSDADSIWRLIEISTQQKVEDKCGLRPKAEFKY